MTLIYTLLVLLTSWEWSWTAFLIVVIIDSIGGSGYYVRDGQEHTRSEYIDKYEVDPELDDNLEDSY